MFTAFDITILYNIDTFHWSCILKQTNVLITRDLKLGPLVQNPVIQCVFQLFMFVC